MVQAVFMARHVFIFSILMLLVFQASNSMAGDDKGFFQIESSVHATETDLTVTSIGALVFENHMVGKVNLNYLRSDLDGDAVTLDMGGGVALRGMVSLFLTLGLSAGYNWEKENAVTAYYPEIGLVAEMTNKIGVSLSGKRYINLYEEDEDVVMLGLLVSY